MFHPYLLSAVIVETGKCLHRAARYLLHRVRGMAAAVPNAMALLALIGTGISLNGQIIPGEYLVQCRPGVRMDLIMSSSQDNGSPPACSLLSRIANVYLLSYDTNSSHSLEEIEKLPDIMAVQRNCLLKPRWGDPNDPLFSEQWSLSRIGASKVWDDLSAATNFAGDTLVIALLESGLDMEHEDLQDILWKNHMEIRDNGLDDDQNGYIDDYLGVSLDHGADNHRPDTLYSHGTSVIGVMAATQNNVLGVSGISPYVKIMLMSSMEQDFANAVRAYSYAAEMRRLYDETQGREGAFVVATNTSFGCESLFEEDAPIFCDMFNTLGELGILSVGAAENDQGNADVFGDLPSNCSSPYLIVTTSTTEQEELAVAGFGKATVDLGAPGEAIWSTKIYDTYEVFSGTSYASPLVCGAIALMHTLPAQNWVDTYSEDPSGTALMLKDLILENVEPVDNLKDNTVSGGRLNLVKTLSALADWLATVSIRQTLFAFPNPVMQRTHIKFLEPLHGFTISVVNTAGMSVLHEQVERLVSVYEIETQGWPDGTYFFRLEHPKVTWYSRFVKLGNH